MKSQFFYYLIVVKWSPCLFSNKKKLDISFNADTAMLLSYLKKLTQEASLYYKSKLKTGAKMMENKLFFSIVLKLPFWHALVPNGEGFRPTAMDLNMICPNQMTGNGPD